MPDKVITVEEQIKQSKDMVAIMVKKDPIMGMLVMLVQSQTIKSMSAVLGELGVAEETLLIAEKRVEYSPK